MELVLEQTQQGTSHEVLVSTKGVKELKRKVKIKGERKEALLTLRQKPEHPSDTKVFTVKMEILLEPTSNKLLVDMDDDVDISALTIEQCPLTCAVGIRGRRLFHFPGVTHDAVMLRVFPITLKGRALRWKKRLPGGVINTWDLLEKEFIWQYCSPFKTAKKLEEIRNFKQEIDETLYHAWERYSDLLYRCLQHDLNCQQKVHIFYTGLDISTRKMLNSRGFITLMTPTHALISILVMADHSYNWYDETTTKKKINDSPDKFDAIQESFKEGHPTKEYPLKKEDKAVKQREKRTTMGKGNMKEPVPRDLPPTLFLGHLKEQMGSPCRTRENVCMIGSPEKVHKMKAQEDEGDMNAGWDITVKDVERLMQLLTPTIHTLPNLELVVHPYMPLGSFYDIEKIVREEEQDYNVPLHDGVKCKLWFCWISFDYRVPLGFGSIAAGLDHVSPVIRLSIKHGISRGTGVGTVSKRVNILYRSERKFRVNLWHDGIFIEILLPIQVVILGLFMICLVCLLLPLKELAIDDDVIAFVKDGYDHGKEIELYTKHSSYDVLELINDELNKDAKVHKSSSKSDSSDDDEQVDPLDNLNELVDFQTEGDENLDIPKITTDDPWLNKLVGQGNFIVYTKNPKPLDGRFILEEDDPDEYLVDQKFKAEGIRRIGNWSNAFSCEVLAWIRRISFVGYSVLEENEKYDNEWPGVDYDNFSPSKENEKYNTLIAGFVNDYNHFEEGPLATPSNPAPSNPTVEVVFVKQRGRSERIAKMQGKKFKFDEHGTRSTLDKAFSVSKFDYE
ncbi:reverse transcriptase domain-containing protein [Tanacetum coccineum]